MGTQVPSRKGHSPHPNFRPIYGLMARSIKMPLGKKVGLDPSDIVLDGNPTPPPPKRGHSPPQFSARLLCPNGWMDQDTTWYGSRSRPRPHCARRGPSPLSKGGTAPFLNFRLMSVVAKWLDGSRCHLVRRYQEDHIVLHGDPAHPLPKGTALQFSADVYCGQTVAHLSYC